MTGRQGWREKRLWHGTTVFLFFLAATAFYTSPLLLELPSALMVGLGDYLGEVSVLTWNAHQVVRDPLHLADAPFLYPYSKTLAFGQSLFFPALVAVPAMMLTRQPLLVANVLLVLALVLSGVFAYRVAFALTGRVGPALLAGVVFAFYPNRMDHLGQFTYQMAVLFPLIFWSFYRFLLTGGWRPLAGVVAGLWAQMLSSLYNGYALGLLLLAVLAVMVIRRPRVFTIGLAAKGLVGLLLLIAALGPFVAPYLTLHRDMGLKRDVGQTEWFGMDLLSLFDPGAFNRLYGGRLVSLGRSEGGMFPGFVALALAVWAVARGPAPTVGGGRAARHGRRGLLAAAGLAVATITLAAWHGRVDLHVAHRRLFAVHDLTFAVHLLPIIALAWLALEARPGPGEPLTLREWTGTLLFLSLVAYLLTLQPTLNLAGHPWGQTLFGWVFRHLPGASAFRAPGRWSLVFVWPFALLAALGLRALEGTVRRPRAKVLSAVVVAAVMVEYVIVPIGWDHLPPTPPVYRWLAAVPDDVAVLELPIASGANDAWAMFWQSVHGKRIVNGALGFVPRTVDDIVAALDPFDAQALAATVRTTYPVRYVIVHSRQGQSGRWPWAALRGEPPPGWRLLRSFGTDDIYEVLGTPDAGASVVRYLSSDYDRRHPTARYAIRFRGHDAEVARWVDVTWNGGAPRRADEGAGEVLLTPPWRAADRNELRFTHRYRVRPEVTESGIYRIGRTTTHSPVDIEVTSGGKYHGNTVSVRVNGHEQVALPRRGYNIVALDPADGRLLVTENFDTFRSPVESARMSQRIAGLPHGAIVVAAVKHDGGGQLGLDGVRALNAIGGRVDLRATLWQSHLVIGVKGATPGAAIEAAGERELSATVGRPRPLDLILEDFALR